ncbi:unnamed protein product [Toxocara canis]|uniref:Rx_N domain-containing protein n=1 Tax=Toxocara canis TaxID=6265 RepID=A0A183U9M2_TOXCA|nr:unnamed protein product [Toxocara canis]
MINEIGESLEEASGKLERGLEEVIAHWKLASLEQLRQYWPRCNDKKDEPSSESTNVDEERAPIMDDRASFEPNRSGRAYDRINEVIEVQVIIVNCNHLIVLGRWECRDYSRSLMSL